MNLKLLIVDDSVLIVHQWLRLLEGFKGIAAIHTAQTLVQAQALIQQELPTLVILDLHLPDGNSIALIGPLKKLTPVVQVAMLTNDASEFNRERCMRAGADWFFDKSTEFEKLLEVVQALAVPH
jgi:two-component system, OmpR family, response regulator